MAIAFHIPKTLVEAIRTYSDPDIAHNFFVAILWPEGVTCPYCQSQRLSFISTCKRWACKDCKKRFTEKGHSHGGQPYPPGNLDDRLLTHHRGQERYLLRKGEGDHFLHFCVLDPVRA